MIKRTIDFSYELEKNINNELINITRNNYMRMAYKKTLAPSYFFQKKQYSGIVHEREPELDDPKLFLKGVKIIKRNNWNSWKIWWRISTFTKE